MEIASSTEILLILILFVLSYFTDFLFGGSFWDFGPAHQVNYHCGRGNTLFIFFLTNLLSSDYDSL